MTEAIQRKCPCGKRITGKTHLCKECSEIYGSRPAEWPAWLQFSVSDLRREFRYETIRSEREVQDADSLLHGRTFRLRGCRTETHEFKNKECVND